MVSYHQRPHPSGHMFHPQSDVPQGLHLLQQRGQLEAFLHGGLCVPP
jgi:hypothetical protein